MAEDSKEKEVTMADVVKAIQTLNSNQQQLHGIVTKVLKGEIDLPTVLELKKKMDATPAPLEKKEDETIDPETMTNAQLVELVVGTIQEKALKPMADHVKSIEDKFEMYKATSEVEEAKGKHKEFETLQSEVLELQKAHPTLPVEDLVILARGKNPEKMKEFEKAQEAEAAKTKGEEKPTFGGLFPRPAQSVENTKMKYEDAAQKAWEEADVDGVLSSMPQA